METMTEKIPDAGELDQKVRLLTVRALECCEGCRAGLEPAPTDESGASGKPHPTEGCRGCEGAPEKGWEWREYRKAWAKVTHTNGLAIFANSGVGGREAEFILRRQSFTLADAILWKDQFCLPTSITPLGPGHIVVKAALVTPRTCKGIERETGIEIQFPGVVTEKYQRHEQLEPMAQNAVKLVLVTPTVVKLKLGSLVTVGEDKAPWWVKIAHEMDPDKHEYEIERIVEP